MEINCETDFVARTEDFKALAHDAAMQVAAMAPRFISEEGDSGRGLDRARAGVRRQEEGFEAVSLLDQPFIKDPKVTIRDLNRAAIGKLGENVIIRRFARFEVGADMPPVADVEE